MKQEINSKVFFGIVGLVVVVGLTFALWVWKRPASAESTPQTPAEAAAARNRAMMEPRGPSPDQMKEMQDWLKAHPEAPSRLRGN